MWISLVLFFFLLSMYNWDTWDAAAIINEIGWDHGHVCYEHIFLVFGLLNGAAFLTCWRGWFSTKMYHAFGYVFNMDFFVRWNIKQKKPIQRWTLLRSHHHHWDHHRHFLLCNHRYKHVSCPFPTITIFHFPCLPLVNSELLFFSFAADHDDILVTYSLAISDPVATHDDVYDHDDGIAVFFIHSTFFSLFPLYFHHQHDQKKTGLIRRPGTTFVRIFPGFGCGSFRCGCWSFTPSATSKTWTMLDS